jgi:ribose-phosphate pyrophosphokinase
MLNSMPFAIIEKNRDLATGTVSAEKIAGKIARIAIIVDDMISSGETVAVAAKLLRRNGVGEIYVFATHAVFSEKASQILQEAAVNKVYVADTVYIPEEKRFPKLEILSVAEMIAKQLKSV